MNIIKAHITHFVDCESTVTPKILLNICDYLRYGQTDTNRLYKKFYVHPERDYDRLQMEGKISLGSCFFSKPLSYHIIANLVCVKFPKTTYNLIPFKYKSFTTSLLAVKDYFIKMNMKEIHTPIFGTKIIEGDWTRILSIIKDVFGELEDLSLYVYE